MFDKFWDLIDQRAIIRRTVLFITIWMSYISYQWATHFVDACVKPGAEIALIIASVLGPITALQGFVFKLYLDSKVDNLK
jgi:hypothetical protein